MLILSYQKVGEHRSVAAYLLNQSNLLFSLLFPDRVARLADIEARWEAKKQTLAAELERVERLLAGAYDK